jgi:putative endonuclease
VTKVTQALGAWGEGLAAAYLDGAGLILLDRNWRCPDGELDIVARDGSTIVFCEVKTRRSHGLGAPIEAVTRAKARRLRRIATVWLAGYPEERPPVRFDVICVTAPRQGALTLEHLRGVF